MINSWTIGNRLPFFIEIKMKLRAILEGRWYTGRNAHQIWAEWAVWARWQILNGSQFFFHFNEKRLSVEKKPVKESSRKQRFKNKLSTLNHANILNTNFRFAFLKRMKHKLEGINDTEPIAEPAKPRTFRKRTRKVKRIRKKLK